MCSELLREYKIWLGELLELLDIVCEDVVPAGHLDKDLYWKTKELSEHLEQSAKAGSRSGQVALLHQYVHQGRALLEAVRAEAHSIRTKNVGVRKDGGRLGKVMGEAEKLAEERGWLPEEFRILLRRSYASNILNSLQMLVNFNFLADEWLNCPVGDLSGIFEVDTIDGMKRVRSGALVGAKIAGSQSVKGQGGYPCIWKASVAG